MISRLSQAVLAPAELAIRPGLDPFFPDYLPFRLARVRKSGFTVLALAFLHDALIQQSGCRCLDAVSSSLPFLGHLVLEMVAVAIDVSSMGFHPVNAAAAWLLLPYLLWVTLAAALNSQSGASIADQFHRASVGAKPFDVKR